MLIVKNNKLGLHHFVRSTRFAHYVPLQTCFVKFSWENLGLISPFFDKCLLMFAKKNKCCQSSVRCWPNCGRFVAKFGKCNYIFTSWYRIIDLSNIKWMKNNRSKMLKFILDLFDFQFNSRRPPIIPFLCELSNRRGEAANVPKALLRGLHLGWGYIQLL